MFSLLFTIGMVVGLTSIICLILCDHIVLALTLIGCAPLISIIIEDIIKKRRDKRERS